MKAVIVINYASEEDMARRELMEQYGIDFDEFQWFASYDGSPCMLCTGIHKRAESTMKQLSMYAKYLRAKAGKEVKHVYK